MGGGGLCLREAFEEVVSYNAPQYSSVLLDFESVCGPQDPSMI